MAKQPLRPTKYQLVPSCNARSECASSETNQCTLIQRGQLILLPPLFNGCPLYSYSYLSSNDRSEALTVRWLNSFGQEYRVRGTVSVCCLCLPIGENLLYEQRTKLCFGSLSNSVRAESGGMGMRGNLRSTSCDRLRMCERASTG